MNARSSMNYTKPNMLLCQGKRYIFMVAMKVLFCEWCP